MDSNDEEYFNNFPPTTRTGSYSPTAGGRIDSMTAPLLTDSNGSLAGKSPVEDKFHLVFIIFYVLGVGCLLPWNFFSNAKKYFSYKLRNNTLNETQDWDSPSSMTEDQVFFLNYLELAALLPTIIFMFINVVITNMVPVIKRVKFSLVILLFLFTFTIILTQVNTDKWQKGFLNVTLITIVMMNAMCAVLQGGVCGIASSFPENYMNAVMGGMGLGGFFAALASLVIACVNAHPVNSGLGYFIIATVMVLTCILGLTSLPSMKFARFYMCQSRGYVVPQIDSSHDIQDYADIVVNSLSSERGKFLVFRQIRDVLKEVWVYGIAICITFTITLTCYPALISSIKSTSNNNVWAEVYFTPVVCFVFFNLFDVLGRIAAGIIKQPNRNAGVILLVASLLRLAFLPVFFFCNISPRHYTIPFFHADWIPATFSVLLGLTNGYIVALCMMYAPRSVQPTNVELTGSIMTSLISIGLGMGSLLSMLLMHVL